MPGGEADSKQTRRRTRSQTTGTGTWKGLRTPAPHPFVIAGEGRGGSRRPEALGSETQVEEEPSGLRAVSREPGVIHHVSKDLKDFFHRFIGGLSPSPWIAFGG